MPQSDFDEYSFWRGVVVGVIIGLLLLALQTVTHGR